MSLYNLKSADGEWSITKFDNDLNVESSYIVSERECSCPAGSRPTCRHRTMLPKMLAVGAEDSSLFYDFERDQFFEPIKVVDDPHIKLHSTDLPEASFVPPYPGYARNDIIDEALEPHSTTASTSDFDSENTGSSPVEAAKSTHATPHPIIGHIKRRI